MAPRVRIAPAWLAAVALSAAADIDPSSVTAFGVNPHLQAGAAALAAGRWQQGVDATLRGLDDVALSTEHRAQAHSNLCAGYVSLAEPVRAMRHCDEALRLGPRRWEAWNNRAAARVRLGEFDEALADARKALELAPSSALVRRTIDSVQQHRRLLRQRRRAMPA